MSDYDSSGSYSDFSDDSDSNYIDDNQELELYIDDLSHINIPNGVWYQNKRIGEYIKLFKIAIKISEMFDSNSFFEIKNVIKLHNKIMSFMIPRIKTLISSRPGADDPYENTPLTILYLVCANCLCYLDEYNKLNKTNKSDDSTKTFIDKRQEEISYCIENTLCVSNTPIKDFNVEELIQSISQLELRWNYLNYSEDLIQYISALETRASHLICRSYDDTIHNIKDKRVKLDDFENDKNICNEYALTSGAEFDFAVKFVSFHEGLTVTLSEKRLPYKRLEKKFSIASKNKEDFVIKVLLNSLSRESQKIHSDEIQDQFRNIYRQRSISPSEPYRFFKNNPTHEEVSPYNIVSEFRETEQWNIICNKSSLPIEQVFHYRRDILGFRIVLHLVMDLLFKQCMRIQWKEFYYPSFELISISENTIKKIWTPKSYATPLFVESLNDACLFWRGKLYVFGNGVDDYLKAIFVWMKIIINSFRIKSPKTYIKPGVSINELYFLLFRDLTLPNPIKDDFCCKNSDNNNSNISSSSSSSSFNNKITLIPTNDQLDKMFEFGLNNKEKIRTLADKVSGMMATEGELMAKDNETLDMQFKLSTGGWKALYSKKIEKKNTLKIVKKRKKRKLKK